MEIQRLIIRIWCQIWPEFKCLTWLFCWVFLLPYMYLGKKLKSAYTCPYKIDWPSAWGRWWVSTDNKRSMPKVCVYIFRSDQISRSVVSDSLQPHESQHANSKWKSRYTYYQISPRFTSPHNISHFMWWQLHFSCFLKSVILESSPTLIFVLHIISSPSENPVG